MSKFLELDIQRFATSVGPLDESFIVEGDSRYNWDEEKNCARSIEYQVHSLNGETISSVYDSRGNDVSASWGVPGTWLIKVFTYPYQNRLTFVSESGSTYSLDIIVDDEFEKVKSNIQINKDLMIGDINISLQELVNKINALEEIVANRSRIVGSFSTASASLSAGAITLVNFSSADFLDTDFLTFANGKVTFKKTGRYKIEWQVRFPDVIGGPNTSCSVGVSYNGEKIDNANTFNWAVNNWRMSIAGQSMTKRNAGDTFQPIYFSSAAATVEAGGRYWVEYMGEE